MAAFWRYSFLRPGILLAGLVLVVAGCGGSGPERAEVKGKVTFKGEPLPLGTISFIPFGDTVGPSSGAEITNGTYSIAVQSGPVIGAHRVEIRSMQKTGKQIDTTMPGESGGPSGGTGMSDEMQEVIPPEFNNESTLNWDIKPGLNDNVDFAL